MSKKSAVWLHFTAPAAAEGGKLVTECNHCRDKLAYHGATSNMRSHLKRKHIGVAIEDTENSSSSGKSGQGKQLKLEQAFRPLSATKRETITQLITNFVVKDIRPLQTVEGENFVKLLKYMEPGYQVPSRRTIVRRIEDEYLIKKDQLKVLLKEASHISLTFDAWTSVKMEGYLGVTGHYINNKNFEMFSFLLSVKPLDDRHTGLNIVSWVEEILQDFEIDPSKVLAAVTDNGSNMKLAKEELKKKYGWYSMGCTAHTLQLCLNNSLKAGPVDRSLAAARRVVQHFKRSEVASSALEIKCTEMQLPAKRLKMDVSTRWNSTYAMLERLTELQWPVLAVLGDQRSTSVRQASTLAPKASDWEIFKGLLPVLKPFAEATDILGGERYVSISLRNPYIKGLKKHLTKHTEDDCGTIKNLRMDILSEMETRFPRDLDCITYKATALDPRYKLRGLSLVDSVKIKNAIELELTMLVESEKAQECDQTPGDQSMVPEQSPTQKSSFSCLVDLAFESSESDGSTEADGVSVTAEVTRFFNGRVSDSNCPLVWWKEHKDQYPNLHRLALKYMCITATSTPSERVFSTAGNTATARRSCLTGTHVEALVFLKHNNKL